jgi:hypothetical protein
MTVVAATTAPPRTEAAARNILAVRGAMPLVFGLAVAAIVLLGPA